MERECQELVEALEKAHGERKIGDGTILNMFVTFIKNHPELMNWVIQLLLSKISGGVVPPIPTV